MKKKPKSQKQSKGILVRLTPKEAAKIRKYAREHKLSQGEALRSLAAEKLFYLDH